jgi:hypothetical protein|tara:strand:+ start:174 stop:281 length:108 start_codon:yes stop_codon:yes gene_type:complete
MIIEFHTQHKAGVPEYKAKPRARIDVSFSAERLAD